MSILKRLMNFHSSNGFTCIFFSFHFCRWNAEAHFEWEFRASQSFHHTMQTEWTCENLSSFCMKNLSKGSSSAPYYTSTKYTTSPLHTSSWCIFSGRALAVEYVCVCGMHLRLRLASLQHFISCAWHSHTVECSSAYWADDGLSMHVYAIHSHEIERERERNNVPPSTTKQPYFSYTCNDHFFFALAVQCSLCRMAKRTEKKNIVLHEKRKRRRHFNFITILCAVYLSWQGYEGLCAWLRDDIFLHKLWVASEWIVRRIAFKSHHLPFIYGLWIHLWRRFDAQEAKKRNVTQHGSRKFQIGDRVN